MATEQDISIRRGRTGTISVTVTGVADWTDIVSKLFAASTKDSTPTIELDGDMSTVDVDNVITFDYVNDDTVDIEGTSLYYEIALYKADGTYIKDVNYGVLTIVNTVKPNPTE